MINVLFVLNSFGTGGSERVVLDICRGIDRERFRPHVTSLSGGKLTQEFDEIGVWNHSLNKKEGVDPGLMFRLGKIIRGKQIDVINAHHFSPFIHSFPGAFLNRCPMIYTDHTVDEIERIPPFWVIIGRLFVQMSYGVLGISHGCTDQLAKTFKVTPRKAFTVLNAIDLARFDRQIDRAAKRHELQIQDGEKVVGIVGNLRKQKNHESLLRAFRKVQDEMNNVKLIIVGDGYMKEPLQETAREIGIESNVLFLGSRLDVDELYQIMDVYCLSSHYEGLPLTILEAMASRVPVAATDVIGVNDVVRNGENGILAKPNNPQDLAKAIIDLFQHPDKGKALSERAYKYVSNHHDLRPWIKIYEDLFINASQRAYV